MQKKITGLLAGLAFFGWVGSANAVPIYADSVTTENVIFFGSEILTGAPDGGGAFLSNTFDPPTLLGSITAGFSVGLTDGVGFDLIIYDCCSGSLPASNELANVFASTDGVSFSLLGAYGNGVNSFDFSGVFGGIVNFVKIVNAGTTNSPDIDAFEGVYAAGDPAPAPVPATLALFGLGLAGLGWSRRKKA